MTTDDLIARLSTGIAPVPRHAAERLLARGLAAGAAATFVITLVALGLRRDLAAAVLDWQFWAKALYVLALALVTLPLVKRLSRPEGQMGRETLAIAAPVLIIALVAIGQWTAAAPPERMPLMMGHSALVCPWLILALSLPLQGGTLWAMRRLAPTNAAAGAVAGLFAGAAAAFIYGLHCNETSLVFVALWYTAGIALSTALGALCGRFTLRW